MIKKISKLALASVLLMGTISYGVSFISLNNKKQMVVDGIKTATGFDAEINGKLGLGIFPPSFILNDTKIYDDNHKLVLEAKSLALSLGSSIFSNQFAMKNIKSISLNEAIINPYSTFAHMKIGGREESFYKIELIKCRLIKDEKYENFLPYDKVEDINASLKYGSLIGGNNFSIYSSFSIDGVKYSFNGDFNNIDMDGNSSSAKIDFSNKTFAINFDGSLAKLFLDPELKGKIDAKVQDMQSISYLVQDYQILQPFVQGGNLGFSADFIANKKKAEVQNINISSKDITNITGSIGVDLSHGADFDIEFSIDSINIDVLMGRNDKQSGEITNAKIDFEKLILKVISNFDFKMNNNLSAAVDINVKNIIINKDKITELHSSIDILEGRALINDFQFKTPGQGQIQLNGIVEHNKVRPKLASSLYVVMNDFNKFKSWLGIVDETDLTNSTAEVKGVDSKFIMKTDLELIPNNLTFNDVKAALNGSQFVGRMLVHNEGNEHLNFTAAVRMNKLDLDDLAFNSKFDDYIYKLFISDFDKTGEAFSHFTKDLRWLRAWNSPLQLELNVDDMRFKKKDIKKFSTVFNLARNQLVVSKISMDSDVINLSGKFALTVPMFRPYITGDMNFNFVDLKQLQTVFPDFSVMNKAYREYLDKKFAETPAKDEAEAQDRKNQLEIASYELNFLGASNYDADMKVRIDNLVADDIKANDINFNLNIANGLCVFKEMSAKALGGEIRLNANVTILTPIPYFNSSFSIINMAPDQLFTFVTGSAKQADGYVNVAGNLAAKGVSKESLYKNMAGNMAFSGIRITWPGMDLSKIVEFSESTLDTLDKMKSIQYYTKYGNSLFDTVKGSIKIANGIIDFSDFILKNSRVSGVSAVRYAIFSKMFSSIERYSFIPIGRNDRLILTIQSKGALNKPTTEVNFDELKVYFSRMLSNKGKQSGNDKTDTIESILRSRRS